MSERLTGLSDRVIDISLSLAPLARMGLQWVRLRPGWVSVLG
jgi:hypothetical protein